MAKRRCSQKGDEVLPQTVESHLVASGREVRCDLLVDIVHMLSFILCASLFSCHDFNYFATMSILERKAVAACCSTEYFSVCCDDAKSVENGMNFPALGRASTFFVPSRRLLFITSSSTGLESLKASRQHCLTLEPDNSYLVACWLQTCCGNKRDIPSQPRA